MFGRATFLALLGLMLSLTSMAMAAEPPDPYLDFAKQLYEDGDYYRAATEAKRFLFLKPDDPRRFEAGLLLARAHAGLGRWDEAIRALEPVLKQTESPALAAEAALAKGGFLEGKGAGEAARSYYLKLIQAPPVADAGLQADVRNKARYRLGWLLLEEGLWKPASEAFRDVESAHPLGFSAALLSSRALEGENLPLVSPQTAGVLSAILPGAGQVYDGRPVDAALAFGFNAVFLYGAIEAYQQESWVVFGLLGLAELAWYGGNIYNAVNGAHIHNREVRQGFLKRLRALPGITLGGRPDSPSVLLTLTFRF